MAEPAETRATRRKRETEARLLDAALRVFVARGYDAATTAEMARAADVAAGTFYLHFRDKRAVYERLARRAAQDLLASWQSAMRPGMSTAERVTRGLALAADYWRADLDRARLLLEGGPSFGSEGHVRFVDEVATALATAAPRSVPARPLALLLTALGIELGRLVVAAPDDTAAVDALLRLMRRSLAHLDLRARPGGRGASARERP